MLKNYCVDYDIKFAHGDGFTTFEFNENKLLTGGIDGEVRCWNMNQLDDDPESFDVGSAIYSISISKDTYYVASDSIDIKSYNLKDGDYKGSVVRCSLNAYSTSISTNQKFLSVGGGDFIIKLVSIEDFSFIELKEHCAPILNLSYDPKNRYLASSSCDGSVCIWDLKSNTLTYKFKDNHKKSNDFFNSSTLCNFSWNSSGNLLAIPSNESVNLYDRYSWKLNSTLKYESFLNVSICVFNQSGNYLAASNTNGTIIVWNLLVRDKPFAIYTNENNISITCLKFHPDKDDLLFATDKNGHLITINLKNNEDVFLQNNLNIENFSTDIFDDDIDFNMIKENEDLNEIKNDENIKKKEIFNENKNENNINLNNNIENCYDLDMKIFENDLSQNDEDDLVDIGAIKKKYEEKINNSLLEKNNLDNKLDEVNNENSTKTERLFIKPIMQPSFQPGSTPIEYENRFMVWNSIGIVQNIKNENENIIDVEFHNSKIYRPIHFINDEKYTIADLNSEALLLVSNFDANDEENGDINEEDKKIEYKSILFCMHFGSCDSNKEWKLTMPDSELIDAIILSDSFAIAATDQKQIRLFSLSGIQLFMFSIYGPVVCMAAQDNLLEIICHNGSGLPGEQSLSMNLLKINEKSFFPLIQENQSLLPVCLSPKSRISWAGFTDEGNPCIVDSMGIVKIYNLTTKNWIPIHNLKSKNKLDNYFVISISEIQEQIRCIPCKGSKYPTTIPKPDVINLTFEIPLCEINTSKTKLEEHLIRINMKKELFNNLSSKGFDVEFLANESNKKQIEILIKLFALAINADCVSLAIEIAYLMPNEIALEGAIRYASQKQKKFVVNKLNEISKEKFNLIQKNQTNEDLKNFYLKKLNKKRSFKEINEQNDETCTKQIKLTNKN